MSNDEATATAPEPTGDELADSLLLSLVAGVGPRLQRALLDRFGTASAVLNAAPSELRSVDKVGPKVTAAIVAARRDIDVAAELERCREHGVTILTPAHA